MKLIINAAMVPNAGTFRYQRITSLKAAAWLVIYGHRAVSYVECSQTAAHLEALCSYLQVVINRTKTTMCPGDEALVCKLAYRVENPATKGQPQPEDWEYGLLEMIDA